jgi:hypothetical protein
MSSPAVQDAARALATGGTWPASIPFRETFNQWVDPATIDGSFSTLVFETESEERLSVGQHEYLERGTISVHIFAPRGSNYASLNAAFEAVRPVILGHLWPAHINILSAGSPEVISPGGEGMHVEAVSQVRYMYQHTGGQ